MKSLFWIIEFLFIDAIYLNKEYIIIDVSKYQGKIDWKKVKESGIEGAIIKCGNGKNYKKNDDPYFDQNVQGCIENNIPFGVYIFSYAKSKEDVESEAKHVIRLVSKYKSELSLPIFYDLELENLGQYAVENGKEFIKIMEDNGYTAGIYTYQAFINKYIKDSFNDNWLWVARYGINDGKRHKEPEIPGGRKVDIWQYTNISTVDGINSKVDMNVFYREIIPLDNIELLRFYDSDNILPLPYFNCEKENENAKFIKKSLILEIYMHLIFIN